MDNKEILEKIKYLRLRYLIPILALIIAFIVIILISFKPNCFRTDLKTVLLSIFCSIFVWALTEIVNTTIQIRNQYRYELNDLIKILDDNFLLMVSLIKGSEEIPYGELKSAMEEMINEINDFIFKSEIYPATQECISILNYLANLYENLYRAEKLSDKEKQKFYEVIILEKDESIKDLNNNYNLNNIYNVSSPIELSFKNSEIPSQLYIDSSKGDISSKIILQKKIIHTKTFRPRFEIKEFMSNKIKLRNIMKIFFTTNLKRN